MTPSKDELIRCVRDLLTLAERYLANAPNDPDQAKLETARALVKGHSTLHRLTTVERAALREAATFRLSGEMEEERYRTALQRALEKL